MFDALVKVLGASFERAPWGWGTLALLIAGYFKIKPLMARLAQEREANLLEERAAEMASMRERMDRLETKLAITEEELRIVRHDLNNTNTAFDLFIERIKANPDDALQHAERVEELRKSQRAQIDREKAAISSARVTAVTGVKP